MIRMATILSAALLLAPVYGEEKGGKVTTPLGFKMKSIEGKEVDLSQYKGKVVLFVNVASECGYTKQYAGLQKLYEKNKDAGLVIVGVPANEFGKQEPGSDKDIAEFCSSKFHVTFPMMSKVVVKGDGISPLYDYLTSKETNPKFAGPIGWNFEKFLVAKDGTVVGRFKSDVEPSAKELTSAIEAELKK
jgi:glutathione peroxidase